MRLELVLLGIVGIKGSHAMNLMDGVEVGGRVLNAAGITLKKSETFTGIPGITGVNPQVGFATLTNGASLLSDRCQNEFNVRILSLTRLGIPATTNYTDFILQLQQSRPSLCQAQKPNEAIAKALDTIISDPNPCKEEIVNLNLSFDDVFRGIRILSNAFCSDTCTTGYLNNFLIDFNKFYELLNDKRVCDQCAVGILNSIDNGLVRGGLVQVIYIVRNAFKSICGY